MLRVRQQTFYRFNIDYASFSVTKAIWNNLFQYQNRKSGAETNEGLWCPSNENPYFAITDEDVENRMSPIRIKREDNSKMVCTL